MANLRCGDMDEMNDSHELMKANRQYKSAPVAVIGLAILALLVLNACHTGTNNRRLFRRASAAEARSDYHTMLACMDAVLQTDPTNAEAYNYRGVAYEGNGDLNTAITNYYQAVRFNGTNEDFRFNLGTALGERGDIQPALSNLDEAIRLAPDYAEAWANRGTVEAKAGSLEKALRDCDTAVALAPDSSDIYDARAFTCAALGYFERAIADDKKAVQLDPKNARAYNSLAWTLATCPVASLRNGGQAVAAATHACELAKWNNWAFIDTLAAAWAEAGDFQKALDYQKQAISMPGFPEAKLGEAQGRMNFYQKQEPYHQPQKPQFDHPPRPKPHPNKSLEDRLTMRPQAAFLSS